MSVHERAGRAAARRDAELMASSGAVGAPTSAEAWAEWIMDQADRHQRNGSLTLNELTTFLPRHAFTEWLTQARDRFLRCYYVA